MESAKKFASEEDFRRTIVEEAKSWVGTRYANTGRVKGVAVNCAQLLFGVAINSGAIPPDSPEPRWYSAQLHVHSKEERLIEYVKSYGMHEISESEVKPGDTVLYCTAASHGHAAIVISWPEIVVHSLPHTGCCMGHGTKEGVLAGKKRRYFTLWRGASPSTVGTNDADNALNLPNSIDDQVHQDPS